MITFSGSPLDRMAARRDDAAWLEAQRRDPRTRFLALRDGKTLVRDNHLLFIDAQEPAILLGVAEDVATFAVELDHDVEGAAFEEMRPLALVLSPEEAAMAGTARSLFEWHRLHGSAATPRTSLRPAGNASARTATPSTSRASTPS